MAGDNGNDDDTFDEPGLVNRQTALRVLEQDLKELLEAVQKCQSAHGLLEPPVAQGVEGAAAPARLPDEVRRRVYDSLEQEYNALLARRPNLPPAETYESEFSEPDPVPAASADSDNDND